MNDIIVAVPVKQETNLIDAAKKGLYGELASLSVAMYDRAITDFLAYAEEQGGEEFGNSLSVAFSSWLRSLIDAGLTASTVKTKKAQLRRFFQWGVRVGWIDHQTLLDVQDVKSPKTLGKKAGRWLDENQLKQLLQAPDTSTEIGRRDSAILYLLVGCALRRSDVSNLRWGNLSKYGSAYVITDLTRKHGRIQDYIPVPDAVMRSIEEYSSRQADDECVIVSYDRHGNRGYSRNGKRYYSITGNAIWGIVHTYCDKLGFGDISPHDLRRSAARYYKITKGISLEQLALVMGHSDPSVTARYVNEIMDIEHIAQAFDMEGIKPDQVDTTI